MQDKEIAGEIEEALAPKEDIGGKAASSQEVRRDSLDRKDSHEGRRESTKDGKFAFRRMKTPKKEKADKKSRSRFEGDGITFKAKLIGLEAVSDARGDKMCQEAMQRLKINVRNTGPHKRKINICISLQGIIIKDDKFGQHVIYHHPVSLISFISQDITDARAFGYVFGSTEEPHQFIAIKTEKPAFHVVLALRDLFQTVLNFKQEEIEIVKENKSDEQKLEESLAKDSEKENSITKIGNEYVELSKPKEENIYFEVLLTEPLQMREETQAYEPEITEPTKTVDDLLGLQNELNKLQMGIEQMDTSIAAHAEFNVANLPESDPFDTSFVLGPKRDSFSLPMPTPVPLVSYVAPNENQPNTSDPSDKYAVFNALDTGPSIFENPSQEDQSHSEATLPIPDLKDLEEEILNKTPAPPKPPRNPKSQSPDQSLFADLDPLGKDRPYKDKAEFFQDVKNPPKKVLNDLVEDSGNVTSSPSAFPVDFESAPASHNNLSSSLPNSFCNAKLSLPYGNAISPFNPFEHADKPTLRTRGSEPMFPIANSPQSKLTSQNNIINNSYLGKSPPSNTILSVNCMLANQNGSQSSSPIPIPPRQSAFAKERSFSNGSIGSPYSKSPVSYESESPNQADYFNHNNYSEGYSPVGITMKNRMGTNGNSGFSENGSSGSASPVPNGNSNTDGTNLPKTNMNGNSQNGFSNTDGPNLPKANMNGNLQNGLSRPRPRPSASKGVPIPSKISNHTHNGSTDNEVINRENMQSITKMLLTNGHRIRAQSLTIESRNDFKLNGENIFTEKNDPFADDFFYSLPKKAHSHIAKKEIPEYV